MSRKVLARAAVVVDHVEIYFSCCLVAVQNLAVVCHSVWEYVKGPKN